MGTSNNYSDVNQEPLILFTLHFYEDNYFIFLLLFFCLFCFVFSFIIHMCIQGLVHFSPLPPPPPLPPTPPPPSSPHPLNPAETILSLFLILL
jgi:hypothetical protein